jgi:hypothetical protein
VDPDPDPVGSETFSSIRIRVRILKNLTGSRSGELRIRNKFEVKLLLEKFTIFTQNAHFKNINFFKLICEKNHVGSGSETK